MMATMIWKCGWDEVVAVSSKWACVEIWCVLNGMVRHWKQCCQVGQTRAVLSCVHELLCMYAPVASLTCALVVVSSKWQHLMHVHLKNMCDMLTSMVIWHSSRIVHGCCLPKKKVGCYVIACIHVPHWFVFKREREVLQLEYAVLEQSVNDAQHVLCNIMTTYLF